MKLIKLIVITTVIIFIFTSCVSIISKKIDEMMNSWLGANKDQLIMQWGPPSEIFDNGDDGEIWTYSYTNQTSGYAYTNNYGQTFWRAPQRYKVVRQFYINKDGIIYAYRWQGA